MDLISLLVIILVLAVIAVLAFWVVGQMGLGEPIALIVRVLVGAILLIALLGMITGYIHVPVLRVR